MLKKLKAQVCEANLALVKEGLVIQTWGNASAIDRESGLVVIKPSGVSYEKMKPGDMVVVSLKTGKTVQGRLKPSSDTATHLVLYRSFAGVGGVVHTHSLYATAWAQAGRALPALGTTQADYWHGSVPVTRRMRPAEIQRDYEHNTGLVIVETFKKLKIKPLHQPSVLVADHGPFAWGADLDEAVHNASVLEFVARLNLQTLSINPDITPISQTLLDKHFLRKHGPGSYYGQKSVKPKK